MKLVKSANGKYKKVYSKKELENIRYHYVDLKWSMNKTAKLANCSPSVMQHILNNNNWMRKKNICLSEKQRAQIHFYYLKKKWSYIKIAKKLKIGQERTRLFIKKNKLTRKYCDLSLVRERLILQTCKRHLVRPIRSYAEYVYSCRRLLSVIWPRISFIVDKQSKRLRLNYVIDHRLSIYDGFNKYLKPIPLKIISHPCNLRVVHAKINNSKRAKSCITLKILKKRIMKFNERYGELKWLNP